MKFKNVLLGFRSSQGRKKFDDKNFPVNERAWRKR